MADMSAYRCPRCHRSDGLWEGLNISGWRSIDANLRPTGEREADWDWVEESGDAGCAECSWNGLRSSLELVGIDGEPLPRVHPQQTSIEAS